MQTPANRAVYPKKMLFPSRNQDPGEKGITTRSTTSENKAARMTAVLSWADSLR